MIAQQRFSLMPTVVKNLLIINGLFFMGMISFQTTFGIDITDWLGLYFPASDHFIPSQLITHMFMHGNLGHIASNMIMLGFLVVLWKIIGGLSFSDLLHAHWIGSECTSNHRKCL